MPIDRHPLRAPGAAIRLAIGILAIGLLAIGASAGPVAAQDKVVATVNGKAITEADMRLAEAEIGSDLGNLPPDQRRRVLAEYLIENQLFAEAAEAEKLATGPAFDERMGYWRRRAARDAFFEKGVKGSISDAETRKFYESQVAGLKTEEEVRARHILVEDEAKAKEIFELIGHGSDFAEQARKHSKDPGSKEDGGDLGYFGRGQMVPQFEETAFKMKKGEVSLPVKSQFGWHLIKLEDRRERKAPAYDAVKERIAAALVHRKAQEIAGGLRGKARIDFVDAELKQAADAENRPRPVPAGPAPAGR